MGYFHSVTLEKDYCKGCTNCIKYCPTEAIRVRDGKAQIIDERCIDCGECIRRCPHQAKKALTDTLDSLKKFKVNVAIPAPSLYGQFKSNISVNQILNTLLKLGFDYVFEAAEAAEIVTAIIKEHLAAGKLKKPAISSACPAVVRLIQVKFPELLDNIIPLESPMEIAARIAKDRLGKELKIPQEEIGVFFLSPCPAKVTSIKNPLGGKKSSVDGVISIIDIYAKMITNIVSDYNSQDLQKAGGKGIGWASSGGEALALSLDSYLAVDGSENVIKVLEELELGRLPEVEFFEGQACLGGCVGGPLTIENSYVAKKRIRSLVEAANTVSKADFDRAEILEMIAWTEQLKPREIMKLDSDRAKALEKINKIEELLQELPGLDCGSCGAPTCRALAEDIVRGQGHEFDCIFKLRERLKLLAENMFELSNKIPPSIAADNKSRGLKE
ncbi:MAG: [Fe-Fe] hydrogenase large subunit C-terminal domain-containing protein [Peptococcaceae bacterium]